MSGQPDHDHAWFRRHLPDHLLDLLAGSERERFDAHARACATCARLLARSQGARTDWWDGAGHVPVDLLLGWDPAGEGSRHARVRAHLEGCASCRADLESLHGAGAAAPIARGAARRQAPAGSFRFGWAPALGGVAGVAAVVTALVLVNREPAAPGAPAPAPQATAPPATPERQVSPPARSEAPPVPAPPAGPFAIRSADRGSEPQPTVVELPAGVTRVAFTLPLLDVPEGASIAIELLASGVEPRSRQVLPAARALRAGGVVVDAAGLAAGRHVLRVSWTDPLAGESLREYPLDVRTSR